MNFVLTKPAKMKSYTQSQLNKAFELVQPTTHWKDKIDAVIPAKKADVVCEAIIHFTGSVPHFTPTKTKGKLCVRAAGYWATIGV